ncbi:polysialyltransferase family glycosyltransferase [uncultured Amnibacterium sp.]|uniref:polysialyltransferase family glycosyltransferase n=1 Tax=uncultured Amnibacterium sp. TaxID=1631851 RepID=UPI0035C95E31
MRRVQVFEASSFYQVMVLAAALDAGSFGDADERILLTSANAEVPEVAPRIDEVPGAAALLLRFDRTASYNDVIHPLHPSLFRPRVPEQPLFERAFRRALGLADDDLVELAVESVHVPPARTILNIFAEAPVTVYAEGLMSYGPTRDPLTPVMVDRVRSVLYLDLVRGLLPELLREYRVPAVAIPEHAFRQVVAELAGATAAAPVGEPYALILGQYLASLHLLSRRAELELYAGLIRTAAGRGLRTVVMRPHPSAPGHDVESLRMAALESGVRFELDTDPVPVEARYHRDPPALVLGCFSTGLVTAQRYFGLPAGSAGAAAVRAALPRFEDSNRIPLVIVEHVIPRVDEDAPALAAPDPIALQALLSALGYCMQWRAHAADRARTAAYLRRTPDPASFIPRSRRRELLLPGGWPLTLGPSRFARWSGRATVARARAAQALALARHVAGAASPPADRRRA